MTRDEVMNRLEALEQNVPEVGDSHRISIFIKSELQGFNYRKGSREPTVIMLPRFLEHMWRQNEMDTAEALTNNFYYRDDIDCIVEPMLGTHENPKYPDCLYGIKILYGCPEFSIS